MNTNTQPLLAWQAPTRTKPERSERWYLVGGVCLSTMITYGILTGSWMMSLTFALIGGLYVLTREEEHHDHKISLLDVGIEYDGHFYSYADFGEFWILKAPTYYELHISSVKSWRPDIVLQTADIDPYVIQEILGQYLPQVGHKKEKLLDAFIRFCKL